MSPPHRCDEGMEHTRGTAAGFGASAGSSSFLAVFAGRTSSSSDSSSAALTRFCLVSRGASSSSTRVLSPVFTPAGGPAVPPWRVSPVSSSERFGRLNKGVTCARLPICPNTAGWQCPISSLVFACALISRTSCVNWCSIVHEAS